MKIIDTDILIDHFHNNRAALSCIKELVDANERIAISVVTVAELLGGMRSGEEDKTEQLLGFFEILPVDEATSRHASTYLRTFRRSHRIDFGDAMIAATACLYESELLTRNVKHYPMTDILVTVPYERGR